jgi:predicted O-linked N-acetylglucosamine transferase (SPINDLY family)
LLLGTVNPGNLHRLTNSHFSGLIVQRSGYPSADSNSNDLLLVRAAALHEQGQFSEAERLYRESLRGQRDNFDVLCRLGVLLMQLAKFREALPLLRRAIKVSPGSAEAHQLLASALTGAGSDAEAIKHYKKAFAIHPAFAEAHNNLGHTLQKLGRLDEAMQEFYEAIRIRPEYAEARNNLGNVLHLQDRLEEAVPQYEKAIQIWPNYAEAHWNLGNAQRAIGRFEEAIGSYEQALKIRPSYVEAHNGLGNTYRILGRHEDAIAQFQAAVLKRQDYIDARLNLGQTLTELERYEAALEQYESILAVDRQHPDSLAGRGRALAGLKRHREAVGCFGQALRQQPDHPFALQGLVRSSAEACDWTTMSRRLPELASRVARGSPVDPLDLIAHYDDPVLHRRCAENFIKRTFPEMPSRLWRGEIWRNQKIRIGYVATGFHEHPTAYLTAELIELHDRKRFEVYGFSLGPDDRSGIRARLKRSFDGFHDLRPHTDEDAARLLSELRLDIIVDRSGHTPNARPGIFARRPGPIQVNYIGYPGTLGADFYDYVIADETVLPFDQQANYVERIVHLPESYLVNDTKRFSNSVAVSREDFGLPANGFVFCCFNLTSKITPQIFDIWMRLLRQKAGSVLWLLRTHPETQENLGKEAAARGVDPARIVYADRVGLDKHLARHALADLFLDTLPYNAHTTANDALLTGLPVVTCLGAAFAGRVAASLLKAIGLQELITDNLDDYETCARKLAEDPALLAELRGRLAVNRSSHPLFDGNVYRQRLEACFSRMWETWQRGEHPKNFSVLDDDVTRVDNIDDRGVV